MKVIKRFNDKATKRRYEVDDNYEGDRAEELEAKGYLKRKKTVKHESWQAGQTDNAQAQD